MVLYIIDIWNSSISANVFKKRKIWINEINDYTKWTQVILKCENITFLKILEYRDTYTNTALGLSPLTHYFISKLWLLNSVSPGIMCSLPKLEHTSRPRLKQVLLVIRIKALKVSDRGATRSQMLCATPIQVTSGGAHRNLLRWPEKSQLHRQGTRTLDISKWPKVTKLVSDESKLWYQARWLRIQVLASNWGCWREKPTKTVKRDMFLPAYM